MRGLIYSNNVPLSCHSCTVGAYDVTTALQNMWQGGLHMTSIPHGKICNNYRNSDTAQECFCTFSYKGRKFDNGYQVGYQGYQVTQEKQPLLGLVRDQFPFVPWVTTKAGLQLFLLQWLLENKLESFDVFKGMQQVPELTTACGVVVGLSNNTWMTEDLMKVWVRWVWASLVSRCHLLVWDIYRCHLMKKVWNVIDKQAITSICVIPGGFTSQFQLANFSWNKAKSLCITWSTTTGWLRERCCMCICPLVNCSLWVQPFAWSGWESAEKDFQWNSFKNHFGHVEY